MKITFEGATARELAHKCLDFANEVLPISSVAAQTELPIAPVAEKKPGRPKKEATPTPVAAAPAAIVPEVVPAEATMAPKHTKEDVTKAMQKVAEHETAKGGNQNSGINAVRGILSRFGVNRLSEIDPKVYHEVIKVCEEAVRV